MCFRKERSQKLGKLREVPLVEGEKAALERNARPVQPEARSAGQLGAGRVGVDEHLRESRNPKSPAKPHEALRIGEEAFSLSTRV